MLGFLSVCCLRRFVVFVRSGFPFLAFDAQGRHLSQDCHHRHDERSTGAKKNVGLDWIQFFAVSFFPTTDVQITVVR